MEDLGESFWGYSTVLVQNEESKSRLGSININSELSGDTRYEGDEPHKVAQIPEAIKIRGNSRTIVFGSSWLCF